MKLTITNVYKGFYTKDDIAKQFINEYGYGVYKNNCIYTNGILYTIKSIRHTVFNGGHLPDDICTILELNFESKKHKRSNSSNEN